MDAELSEKEKNHIYAKYPKVFSLKNVLWNLENYWKERYLHYYTYLLRNIKRRY